MYAVVDISGKQYKVSPADRIYVPSLDSNVGDQVEFQAVKLLVDDKGIVIGTPDVASVSVTAKVLGHVKDDKVIVFKKKRRKGYRVKKGHRQGYTQIEIDSIVRS